MEWRDVISQIEDNQNESVLALEGKRSWPMPLEFNQFSQVSFPKSSKALLLGLLSRNESLIEAINARKEVLSELLASSKRPELNRPLAVDIHA